jgi:hypothetical protein
MGGGMEERKHEQNSAGGLPLMKREVEGVNPQSTIEESGFH